MGSTQVVVTLTLGKESNFGVNEKWEAALYEGATPGEETDRRFSNWIKAVSNTVVIIIPEDARDEFEIPMGKERDTYVRIRSTDGYPSFDMVTKPFTLLENVSIVVPVTFKTDSVEIKN